MFVTLFKMFPQGNDFVHMSVGGSSDGKEPVHNAGDPGSIPGLGRVHGEGNVTHSSILAWRIPRAEEPGRLLHGVAELGMTD